MTDSWSKLKIVLEDNAQAEVLMAWLNILDADSVIENEADFEVYIDTSKAQAFKEDLKAIEILKLKTLSLEVVENQNWNALWESQFEPLLIEDIYVRAQFHDPAKEGQRELLIQPKMAFGTGHHETTFMMLEKMNHLNFADKRVLDYGCGTGILSVFAAMQNAQHVVGIDIQPEAIENTIEHFDINGLSNYSYEVAKGDLELVQSETFDVILANINRHVLLQRNHDIYNLLSANGELFLSGILKTDEQMIVDAYKSSGFKLLSRQSKGEWCLFYFKKAAN